jgi:glycerol kinase
VSRRDKRIVKQAGSYRIIEIEFVNKKTGEIIDTCFEVRKMEKFLVEFDNAQEALMQLEFMLKLERENRS